MDSVIEVIKTESATGSGAFSVQYSTLISPIAMLPTWLSFIALTVRQIRLETDLQWIPIANTENPHFPHNVVLWGNSRVLNKMFLR